MTAKRRQVAIRGRSQAKRRAPPRASAPQLADSPSLPQLPTIQAIMESWMGRFPHPDDAERYEQIHPGFLDRHFRLYETEQKIVEKQSSHRQEQERRRLEADILYEGRGLTFAFVLAVLLIAGGFVLGMTGHEAASIAFIGTGLVSGAGAFIIGQRGATKERLAKLRMLSRVEPEESGRSSREE